MNIKDTFYKTLYLLALLEVLSFIGYFSPPLNYAVFLAILGAVLYFTLDRLEYGIYAVLAELFIGSMGYIFSFPMGGTPMSLRIALWLTVMGVWAGKTLSRWIKEKKIIFPFLRHEFFPYFAVLFVFMLWGFLNGHIRHNDTGILFLDFKRWIYFALLFPVFDTFIGASGGERENIQKNIMSIFSASVIWLSIETLLLLYVFTHGLVEPFGSLYKWIRDTRVGEITPMAGGFFRVFIQSQIFILIYFFVVAFGWMKETSRKDFFIASLASSVVIANLSRSFWVGLAAGVVLTVFFAWKEKRDIKKAGRILSVITGSVITGLILMAVVAKFPIPRPLGGYGFSSILSNRATDAAGEAGASSRLALWPKLWEKIRKSPVLGSGFGTTVTYKTNDPRIVKSTTNSQYTTYAFEWGWLDIWIKLGLFGLIAYIVLIAKIFIAAIKNRTPLTDVALAVGLAVVCVVSFFSPYTNHPLGIGYLIMASAIISRNRK